MEGTGAEVSHNGVRRLDYIRVPWSRRQAQGEPTR